MLRSLVAASVLLISSGASASEMDELKVMLMDMKQDYETKISALEAKIEQLESNQQMTTAKVEQVTAAAQSADTSNDVGVEYIGRRNAPVGAGGLLVRNPFGFGNVSLGGYVDMEYHDLDNTNSTFRQHRWIINIGAEITDRLRFNSEYEIEYGGSNAPGADGEDHVEQAYLDYLINDRINVRAGALLVPFGRYNLYHDSDLQDLTERPLLARDIIPTTWTEAGAGFFGEFNPTIGSYEDLVINYETYVVNGLDAGFSDTGLGGARGSFKTDNNNGKSLVGRVMVSPQLGHEFAVSGYTGEYDTSGHKIDGLGFDMLHTFGPLELIGEYAFFNIEEGTTDIANDFDGAYVQANYHFWPEFLNGTFLARDFENPTLTLVGRYDWAQIDDDSDAGTGDNEEKRYTIGLNYRPVENFVWKIDYYVSEKDNETLEFGNNDGIVTSVAFGF